MATRPFPTGSGYDGSIADTSQQKVFGGSVTDPSTVPGAVLAVGDIWEKPQVTVVQPPPPPNTNPVYGAADLGTASYSIPGTAKYVDCDNGSDTTGTGTISNPWKTVAKALTALTTGTIVLRGAPYCTGIYSEQNSISASQNITIYGAPGEVAWFDGSKVVTGWVQSGAVWTLSGWTYQFDSSASYTTGTNDGSTDASTTMASHPDMVFIDGTQLVQVDSTVTPAVGQFNVNYTTQTITIGSNPTGHEVRASYLSRAFTVSGVLNLYSLGWRRYATPMPASSNGTGTVYYGGSTGGSVVENCHLYDCATSPVSLSQKNVTFNRNTILRAGFIAIHSTTGPGCQVTNNLVKYSNWHGWKTSTAGGIPPNLAHIKVTRANPVYGSTAPFVVADNYFANDATLQGSLAAGCQGIWFDITCYNVQVYGNEVVGAGSPTYGIEFELSDTVLVANNKVTGFKYGITAFNTGNVKAYNNDCNGPNGVWDFGALQDTRRNADSATLSYCPWVTKNISVRNNYLHGRSSGSYQFIAAPNGQNNTSASQMNIDIQGNLFPQVASTMVGWGAVGLAVPTPYDTPAALDSGLGVTWQNSVTRDDTVAFPLPTDVAAVIGVPAGTAQQGTFF